MSVDQELSAHRKPPEQMRLLFKRCLKVSPENLHHDPNVLDLASPDLAFAEGLRQITLLEAPFLWRVFSDFLQTDVDNTIQESWRASSHASPVYEVKAIPGLLVIPALLSRAVQVELLNRLFHRDLSNPLHMTNLNLHYNLPHEGMGHVVEDSESYSPYPSFFSLQPSLCLTAKDSSIHKPLSVNSVLKKKLRWMTLGGQYDWTAKKYPPGPIPPFPPDIQLLLRRLFPAISAQAAIVNLYSPGDTLSVHRDVSEECDRGLISISMGCDGIFIIGNDNGSPPVIMRLRSGDAVCMTGASRYAWHAVPKVLGNTCPAWLKDWPATVVEGEPVAYESWRGWMADKRINLNVRQMVEAE